MLLFVSLIIETLKLEIMYNAEKLQKKLPQIEIEKTLIEPTSFITDDGVLCIWAFDGKELISPYKMGGTYIHPELEKWAKDNGYYWYWNTPVAIRLEEIKN